MPEETSKSKQSDRIKYNMDYLKLTKHQCEIHDIIMQSNIDTWPASLTALVKQQGIKYGLCAELIVSCVADWIAGRKGGDE